MKQKASLDSSLTQGDTELGRPSSWRAQSHPQTGPPGGNTERIQNKQPGEKKKGVSFLKTISYNNYVSQSKYSEKQTDDNPPYTVTPARTGDQQGHQEALATCPQPSKTRMGISQTITKGRKKTSTLPTCSPRRPVGRPQVSAPGDGRQAPCTHTQPRRKHPGAEGAGGLASAEKPQRYKHPV